MSASADHDRFHLAIVQPHYRPDGGVERFIHRAVGALRERGLRVSIITRRWEAGSGNPSTTADDDEVIICNPPYLGRTMQDVTFARAACRTIATLRPDCVQSQARIMCCEIFRAGGGVHASWLEQRARSTGRLRRRMTAASPYHQYVLRAERALFTSPRLRAIICNSRMVRDEVQERFAVPDEKLHVIYNGVDHETFRPPTATERENARRAFGCADHERVVLFVGSGFARKGLDTLLQAVARLDSTWRVLVVGRDKNQRGYVRRAHALGIGERVRFAGRQEYLLPYYHAADLFALPTRYDPFANATLEAMACGLPTLTSPKCGAVDLIEHQRSGMVIDALDVYGWSEALAELNDETSLRMMGRAGRELVRPLTTRRMVDQLTALYQGVLRA